MTTELENALRTAAESNGSKKPSDGDAPNDLMGLAAKLLPRLLENAEEREALVELQKGGFSTLRKQVLLARRALRDLQQSQAEVLQRAPPHAEVAGVHGSSSSPRSDLRTAR